MKEKNNYLYTDNAEQLQIPYEEYVELIEKAVEGQRCREIKDQVLARLAGVLGIPQSAHQKESQATALEEKIPVAKEVAAPSPEKISAEPSVPATVPPVETKKKEQAATPELNPSKQPVVDAPPIKKDIAEHFNKVDESGRLFNIFKQYYTCMNDACGGTVRVTIKDGICSIWNYDEWEEFAFVDVCDGRLRIGVNPRYTDQLKSLDLCEVPRLLASRHSLICVQVDDLNPRVLDTLVTAFNEVGAKA